MKKEPLRFNKDGKFKIMLIGDLHEYYDMKSDNAAAKVIILYKGYNKNVIVEKVLLKEKAYLEKFILSFIEKLLTKTAKKY